MITWLARLSCNPDLFCSAALIASSFCLITNTLVLEEVDELSLMSLDYETNMAVLSFLSGSQLKKQAIYECDFADTD